MSEVESEPGGGRAVAARPPLSLTDELARYWSEVRFSDVPAAVLAQAKRHILDTIAVVVAGAGTDEAQMVRRAAEIDGFAGGKASVWGSPMAAGRASAAAFCNGTAAHSREFDDCGGGGHGGSVVVPAAIAAAETRGAGGAEVMLAVVAGYDVGERVLRGVGGYPSHTARGWHATGTTGTYAAAAAAAKTLGLDAVAYRNALGIGGTFTGGTWAFHKDGTMTKRMHPGKAAEGGVEAAFLAQEGFTGPAWVLDAEWGGFLGTYGSEGDPDAVIAGLGDRFALSDAIIKPYACCGGIHCALDAVLELQRRELFGARDVERVTVHVNAATERMVGGAQGVESIMDAQFSMPYSIAVALDSGRADLSQYEPLRTSEEFIRELMARVKVVIDQPDDGSEGAIVDIQLAGRGDTLRASATIPLGSPDKPISEDQFRSKIRGLLEPTLGSVVAAEIIDMVAGLETVDQIGSLTSLLRAR